MTLYDILGTHKEASQEEIKKAYRNKAKENHEDKGGNHEDMTEINKAWMVLRDPKRRDKYDKTGSVDNESFDFKFGRYVQEIFINIVDQNEVDYTDLIGEFKAYNELMSTDNRNRAKGAKARLRKLGKVLKRLGDNPGIIGDVVRNNIEGIKVEIGTIEDNIKFLEECGECLASYHYSFDEKPTQDAFITYTGFTFNR